MVTLGLFIFSPLMPGTALARLSVEAEEVYMDNPFVKKVNEIVTGTASHVINRAKTYETAGVKNLSYLEKRGQVLLLRWIQSVAGHVEERAEFLFWTLSTPIGWLTRFLDRVEETERRLNIGREKKAGEKKLQEDEVSRMTDEGGPSMNSGLDDETPEFYDHEPYSKTG